MVKPVRSLAFIVMCLASTAGVRGDDDKNLADDLKKMQGAWIYKTAQGDEYRWVFEGDTLKSMVGSGTYVSKLKLDPKAEPHTADLQINEAPDDSTGQTALAIYKFDGDTLKFCFAQPGETTRPTEFQSVAGEFHLIELKRAK